MPSSSAAIIGGGIGGLAAARGLALAGWQVEVYEQAPEFAPVGAGLALEPNAVAAFDWLGLGEPLRARGMRQGPAGLRTAGGSWLLRSELEEFGRRHGNPAFELHRADVHQVLIEGLRGLPVTVHLNHRATRIDPTGDRPTVTFDGSDGPMTVTADVVIGADGLHSVVRSQLFPDHPGPVYVGYVTWRGVAPAERVEGIRFDAAAIESWGIGRRFGYLPLPDGRVYWFYGESTPEGSQRDLTVAVLAERLRSWHDPIPRLLAATPEEALLRNDIYTMTEPLPSYQNGRVVLLGDAAHPMTPDLGQGAAMAVEDAVVLVAELADGPGHVSAALERYDQQRRPRTTQLMITSARIAKLAQARHPVTAGLRNVITKLIPTRLFHAAIEKTLGWAPPPTTAGKRRLDLG